MNKLKKIIAGVVGVAMPLTAIGGEIGEIEWHGFLTSAVAITSGAGDGVEYSGGTSDDAGVKDSRMGLSLSTRVDENWILAAQMKALGTEDYNLIIDWAFASYQVLDTTTVLRFGKIKYPVGLVNEYVEVGYSYPWIRPPESFYSQDLVGPNMTRISFSGADASFTKYTESSEYTLRVFSGVVDVPDGHVNQLIGAKFSFNLDDEIRFEVATNTGEMEITDSSSDRFVMMDGQRHTTHSTGFMIDGENLVFYSEFATATMGPALMDTDSAYVTLGYRFGDYLPSVTFEKWDVQGGWGQEVVTLGVRKELSSNTALKVEFKQITPEVGQKPPCLAGPSSCTGGQGLFDSLVEEEDVNLFSVALEFVF